MRKMTNVSLSSAVAGVLLLVSPALAIERTWTGADAVDPYDFNLVSNWSPSTVSSLSADRLTLESGDNAVSYGGFLQTGSGSLTVGSGALVTIRGGTYFAPLRLNGGGAGVRGTLVTDKAATYIEGTDTLTHLRVHSTGTLTLGGMLGIGSAASTNGTLTVDGTAVMSSTTSRTVVGGYGVGNLTISGNATFNDIVAGESVGSDFTTGWGIISLTGNGHLTAHDIDLRHGTLTTEVGTSFSYNNLTSDSSTTIRNLSGDIYSTGTTTIRGDYVVPVSGAGTIWNANTIVLGGNTNTGDTTLHITDGACVAANDIKNFDMYHFGEIVLDSGMLSLDSPYRMTQGVGISTWKSGIVEFRSANSTDDSGLYKVFGYVGGDACERRLTLGKELRFAGELQLTQSLIIDGGTLAVEDVNLDYLDFRKGTLRFSSSETAIGPSGRFGNRLTVSTDKTYRFDNVLRVDSTGQVILDGGWLIAGRLENHGQVRFTGDLSLLGNEGSQIENYGVIDGGGTVLGGMFNQYGGRITVGSGKWLMLNGYAGLQNQGLISVNAGRMDVQNMAMNSNGAVMAFSGSQCNFGMGLSNDGRIDVSGGNTDLFGQVYNNENGQILVFGGNAYLHGNLTNQGVVSIGKGSILAVYGNVSGNGAYINDGGTLLFAGQISPGKSPGFTPVTGDADFASTSILEMEIAGTDPSEYDRYDVSGTLSLHGGELRVVLLDAFVPQYGQSFDMFDWGSVSGTFGKVTLPELSAGLEWDTSRLYTDGVVGVVPEPSLLGLVCVGAVSLAGRRRGRVRSR